MPVGPTYSAAPIFKELGEGYGEAVTAAEFPKTILRFRNDNHAKTIGLEDLTDEEWIGHFGAFKPLPENIEKPIAQAYHGHQFRHYNQDIGDGRGFLFAQMKDDQGRILDLGTKGSGQTPYSREGDGRLTLKGGVREVLATEMLEALGVNTSKSFSLIETGEALMRGDEPSPTRSSVLVRLSHGHIRIGSFQRLSYLGETDKINQLVDYVLKHYFQENPDKDLVENALRLLTLVAKRTATLAAETMAAGFVHGVLNSDNINVTGESFDYGPWRFLDRFDPTFTAAYFDETGLYAYGRQPEAIHWDLYQLGGSLVDVVGDEQALRMILDGFPSLYSKALTKNLVRRLGVKSRGETADDELLRAMNDFFNASKIPFERLFFDWYGGTISTARAATSPHTHLYGRGFGSFLSALKGYKPINRSALDHAYFKHEVPCTMLIDEVEAIWSHIDERDDWSVFEAKIDDIREMGEALA